MKNGRYTIGEISRLCAISASKLRYLDERGVITPCFVDAENGYRYYDEDTLLQISVLKYYQHCGFKLKDVEALLQRMTLKKLPPMFTRQITALEEEMRRLQMQRDSLLAWQELVQEALAAFQENTAAVRHAWFETASLYVSTPQTGEDSSYKMLLANLEMINYATTRSATVGPTYLYFPKGKRQKFRRIKLYIRPHPLSRSVLGEEIVGGFCALTCYHRGPFAQAEEAYEKIKAYARAHALSLRGDSFERSVIDWWSTQQEEEFLLEIICPLTESKTDGLPARQF